VCLHVQHYNPYWQKQINFRSPSSPRGSAISGSGSGSGVLEDSTLSDPLVTKPASLLRYSSQTSLVAAGPNCPTSENENEDEGDSANVAAARRTTKRTASRRAGTAQAAQQASVAPPPPAPRIGLTYRYRITLFRRCASLSVPFASSAERGCGVLDTQHNLWCFRLC
jgi:hypothetical protein